MNTCLQNKAQKGFTIVETLVAITILMIAIAGPLTIANQAFHAALDAKNQMIATNLAQEAIEEVRNYKDNHIQGGKLFSVFGSLQGLSPDLDVHATPGSGGSFLIGTCPALGGDESCQLFLNPSSGYTHASTGNAKTPFIRQLTLQPIPLGSTDTAAAPASEYLLTVTVSWTTGTVPNQIQIEELLSAATR